MRRKMVKKEGSNGKRIKTKWEEGCLRKREEMGKEL